MRAFSTNTELLSSNWFADHLYRSDFWSICHRPPCPSTEQHAWREPFPTPWELGYSHHSLAALPLHVGSVLVSKLPPTLSTSASQLFSDDIKHNLLQDYLTVPNLSRWDTDGRKALWKNRLGGFPNSPSLSVGLEKKMYSFVLLCKRCQVHFGMHFKVTWSHLNIKKASGICISSFWGFTIRELNR